MFGADVAGNSSTTVSTGDRSEPVGELAGRWLSIASVLPALLATAWVVAAFPLAALGAFRPALVVPLAAVMAAVIVPLGLSLLRRSAVTMRGPWWSVIATGAVAVGFTVFAALTHSEHVVPRRDAGSYAQIGYWLAHSPGTVYHVPLAAFGGSPGALGFASPAFYQHGGATVVPQFMTGWPTLLAGADWVGGWTGLLLLPTLVGGCAILAVGGLAARLLGARWAPLAALLTAGAWPVLRASQETLSEPIALLTLVASACLLVDLVLVRDQTDLRGPIGRHCFALGLLLTAGELVRVDFGVDFAFVLPIVGWLWLTRRPGVLPFLAGSLLGGVLGVLDGAFVTRTYIKVNWSSVKLMLVLLALMAVAVVVGVFLLRIWGHRSPRAVSWWHRVPPVGATLVALVGTGLFVRPYVLIDHSTTDPGVLAYVETMQRKLGLPVDGTRGYAEQSLRWVSWYLGWAAVLAAGVAAVFLTWRVLRGRDLRWLPVLLIFQCPAVLTLVRPGITPDHPWADRRLVVEVLPCVALLATWTTAAIAKWAGAHRPAARLASRALVPIVVASFLVPMGIALTPVAVQRTEQGEVAVIGRVCGVLGRNDTVLMVDQLWMPVVREQCGLPVAQLKNLTPAGVAQVAASVRAAGRTPVITGSQLDSPTPLALAAYVRITLDTRQDDQQLVRRPDSTVPLNLQFWAAKP
ncbi:MAG TPA: hypothetical protein VFX16_36180 [Pseudonocardiaceae bacterium]|nr:hypothetical protein [Pseudonocardiaceae bacterium]